MDPTEAIEANGLCSILPDGCGGKLETRALLKSLDSTCPVELLGLGLCSLTLRISAIPASMAAAVSTNTEYTLIRWERILSKISGRSPLSNLLHRLASDINKSGANLDRAVKRASYSGTVIVPCCSSRNCS